MLATRRRASVGTDAPCSQTVRAALTATLIALAACGGATTEEAFVPDVPTGGDELEFTPPAAGQTVGRFEVVVPDAAEFTLRGTLPLQPDVFGDSDSKYTLAVLDAEGDPVPTQLEVVSRFANASSGADVVEVIARMPRPAGASTGSRARFDVVAVADGPTIPSPSGQTVDALGEGTEAVPNAIQALIDDPFSIRLRTYDVFGHAYNHFPLQQQHSPQVRRYGPLMTTVRTYGVMRPGTAVAGSSGTLDHMFGVHSYFSTLAEEEVLLVDLRFNNGPDNHDPTTTDDDPMGKLYFESIEMRVPAGYEIIPMFDDLGAGTPFNAGAFHTYPLVEDLAGNKLHVMRSQGQFVRRLAIAPSASVERARDLLALEGRAFCRAGTDSGSGDDYYSWWNELTARYFPQRFQLPSLNHVGLANVRSQLAGELANLHGYFDTGTGSGTYPVQHPRLGYFHGWGVAYGGMTGGDEIVLWDGVRTAASASFEGLELKLLQHRMHTDRHPTALWGVDGTPATVDDWLVAGGAQPYIPMQMFITPLNANNPFGFNTAPTFQSDAAVAQGRTPSYEGTYLSYGNHLMTHIIRYTRGLKTLIWLTNDDLAKDDLRLQAELIQMSYTPYYTNAFGGVTQTSMRFNIDYIEQYPNNGASIGRQEGWSADTMAAYYAIADPAWRAAYVNWFEEWVDHMAESQVLCNGLIYAQVNNKILNAKYRGAQAFETSIVDNAFQGVLESVFRGADAGYTALSIDVLRDFYDGFISDIAWHKTLPGPANMYAVGPLADTAAAYCNPASVPSDGQENAINTYQTMSTLGYAYDLTGDPTYLDYAEEITGGDLFTELMADGTSNVSNRAALLAVVQKLNDVL